MNFAQFKVSVFHVCLTGVVVTYWSFTQEVAGSSPFNDKYSGKTPLYTGDKAHKTRGHIKYSLILYDFHVVVHNTQKSFIAFALFRFRSV